MDMLFIEGADNFALATEKHEAAHVFFGQVYVNSETGVITVSLNPVDLPATVKAGHDYPLHIYFPNDWKFEPDEVASDTEFLASTKSPTGCYLTATHMGTMHFPHDHMNVQVCTLHIPAGATSIGPMVLSKVRYR